MHTFRSAWDGFWTSQLTHVCVLATWNGAIVAVKVIFHRENIVSADEDVAREASLSSDLRHPNVVQTFMQATRIVTETSDKVR